MIWFAGGSNGCPRARLRLGRVRTSLLRSRLCGPSRVGGYALPDVRRAQRGPGKARVSRCRDVVVQVWERALAEKGAACNVAVLPRRRPTLRGSRGVATET